MVMKRAGASEIFVCYYHGCRKRVDRRCFERRCRRMVKLPVSSLRYANWGMPPLMAKPKSMLSSDFSSNEVKK